MVKTKYIPEGWDNSVEEFNNATLQEALVSGKIIQGYVSECDSNYNLHIKLGDNLTGILPRNELEEVNSDEYGFCNPNICKNKVNNYIQFKVKEVYDNSVILSRKKAQREVLEWVKNELKPGDVVNGIIKNMRKFGAFVEIGGGVVGLLHIEDISVSRIKSPEERFNIGQKIKVVVKSIDRENNKIILSYKELLRRLGRKHKRLFRKNNC